MINIWKDFIWVLSFVSVQFDDINMNRIFVFSLKLQNTIYLKQLHKSEQNLQGDIKENTIALLAIIFF